MKKTTLINHRLSEVIAMMGHKDTITIADSGLPIPKGVERIDLALTRGIPSFLDTLRAVLSELNIEEAIVASEMKEVSPNIYDEVKEIIGDVPVREVSHEELKAMTRESMAVVRTGEYTSYCNIILKSGVVF
ncbi:D-ribose pyranase [Calorimonas adulescens]|jgi:RbsD / FucU transport protein family.|uniref:D-ribose pyranase n=1 Tax=Calorimonas adulescens TaxID=2606906 RepID=A0A5D8Q768_9THEO|nr:D-ribose pyranase [Calorimonas adulescens]TZE80287.1 D-ribose pyranase [Calorimonas adulescens]